MSSTMGIIALPPELLHSILALLDSPSDLLSLAYTSRLMAREIIPHHSDFRIIRFRVGATSQRGFGTLDERIWKVLSGKRWRGAVRGVRILEVLPPANLPSRTDRMRVPRVCYGHRYEDEDLDMNNSGSNLTSQICTALNFMITSGSLHTLIWSAPPLMDKDLESIVQVIYGAVDGKEASNEAKSSSSLQKVLLTRRTGSGVHPMQAWPMPPNLSNIFPKPLALNRNLTHLSLHGDHWFRPQSQTPSYLITMLSSVSATLTSLSIPMECGPFLSTAGRLSRLSNVGLHSTTEPETKPSPQLRLPHLKQFKCFLQSGASCTVDKCWVDFLVQNGSELEDCWWYPIGSVWEEFRELRYHEWLKVSENDAPDSDENESVTPKHGAHLPDPATLLLLPKLKVLSCNDHVIEALVDIPLTPSDAPASELHTANLPRRDIHSLDLLVLSPDILNQRLADRNWETLNYDAVKRLRISDHEGVGVSAGYDEEDLYFTTVDEADESDADADEPEDTPEPVGDLILQNFYTTQLPFLFPNVEYLALPGVQMNVASWLHTLPTFRELHTFRGEGLWGSVSANRQLFMEQVIPPLVQRMPKLSLLDWCEYWRNEGSRIGVTGGGWGDLVIHRERVKVPVAEGSRKGKAKGKEKEEEKEGRRTTPSNAHEDKEYTYAMKIKIEVREPDMKLRDRMTWDFDSSELL